MKAPWELDIGDHLTAVTTPGEQGYRWRAGHDGVMSIAVGQILGPMGYFQVASLVFEDERPDMLIPLHMAESFEVLNP